MSQETDKNFVPITVTIQPEILVVIDKVCEELHINRSECLRRSFGVFLKQLTKEPPLAGVFIDGGGTMVFCGLATDEVKTKVAAGEWKLLRSF
jgi:hypothetical protein